MLLLHMIIKILLLIVALILIIAGLICNGKDTPIKGEISGKGFTIKSFGKRFLMIGVGILIILFIIHKGIKETVLPNGTIITEMMQKIPLDNEAVDPKTHTHVDNIPEETLTKLYEQSQYLSKTTSPYLKTTRSDIKLINQGILKLLEKNNIQNFVLKGYALYKLKEYEKAVDSLTKAKQINQNDVLPYIYLSACYFSLREYDKALEELAKAEKLNKNNQKYLPMIWKLYAFIYSDLDEEKKSINFYKKVIDTDNEDLIAWQNLTKFYIKHGNNEQVKKTANKAIKHFPDDPFFLLALGLAFQENNQQQEALKYLEKIDDSQLENELRISLFQLLSIVYSELKNFNRAEFFSKKILDLDPQNEASIKIKALSFAKEKIGTVKNSKEIVKMLPTPNAEICLKNGSCLEGINIIPEENGYWFFIAGGKIFFNKSEISSIKIPPKEDVEQYMRQREVISDVIEEVSKKNTAEGKTNLKNFLNKYGFDVTYLNCYENTCNVTYVSPPDIIVASSNENMERRINYCIKYENLLKNNAINAILRGKIFIGMKTADVIASLGYPNDINRSVFSFGVHEQWIYKYPKTLYIYLENDTVISFQD